MIDPESLKTLGTELKVCMQTDRAVLDALREEIRPLRDATRRINPRATTALSLVATDGGNNVVPRPQNGSSTQSPGRALRPRTRSGNSMGYIV